MKMRRTVRRAAEAWMAAECNGIIVLVASVGIAAIAVFKRYQREQPRLDADTTKLHGLRRLTKGWRQSGQATPVVGSLSCPVSSHAGPLLRPRDHCQAIFRAPADNQPHPLGAADRRAAAI